MSSISFPLRHRNNNKKRIAGGAVFIEFLLIVVPLFLTAVFFIEITFTYIRYNLLVFASEKISREVAINMVSTTPGTYPPNPSQVESRVLDGIKNVISATGNDSTSVQFTPLGGVSVIKEADVVAMTEKCYLVIDGVQWPSFSITQSLFSRFKVTVKTKALIEDPCYVC